MRQWKPGLKTKQRKKKYIDNNDNNKQKNNTHRHTHTPRYDDREFKGPKLVVLTGFYGKYLLYK